VQKIMTISAKFSLGMAVLTSSQACQKNMPEMEHYKLLMFSESTETIAPFLAIVGVDTTF
jgi:hypothetical protein